MVLTIWSEILTIAISLTNSFGIESILKKVEALFIKNAEDIKPAIKSLLSDTQKRQRLSQAAKESAKQFNIDSFVSNWSQLIEEARSEIYIR